MDNERPTPFLTVPELSQWLRMKVSTIRKKVCYDQIPYLKVGRSVVFEKEAIERWLRSNNPQIAKWESMDVHEPERYNLDVR